MAKCIAFCGKTEGVLWQNAARFMAKRIPFPYKTLPVLIRNATTACYTDPTPNPSPGKGLLFIHISCLSEGNDFEVLIKSV